MKIPRAFRKPFKTLFSDHFFNDLKSSKKASKNDILTDFQIARKIIMQTQNK